MGGGRLFAYGVQDFSADLLALIAQALERTASQIVMQNEVHTDYRDAAIDEYQYPQRADFGKYLLERCAHALHADIGTDGTAAREYLAEHIEPVREALLGQ